MEGLVLVHQALKETSYSASHLTLLLREGKVQGQKIGRIWLVNLQSLKTYEAQMEAEGPKKFDPTKNQ